MPQMHPPTLDFTRYHCKQTLNQLNSTMQSFILAITSDWCNGHVDATNATTYTRLHSVPLQADIEPVELNNAIIHTRNHIRLVQWPCRCHKCNHPHSTSLGTNSCQNPSLNQQTALHSSTECKQNQHNIKMQMTFPHLCLNCL